MQNYDRVKSDLSSAQLYTRRKPDKHKFEMQMVSEAFQLLPNADVKNVLDAPCGVGRLSHWLAQNGFDVTAVDLGEAAVQLTKNLLREKHVKADVECGDIFDMRFTDGEFDAVICFRLLHHFKDLADQQTLITELCRVSSRFVVISYFSTYSVTTIKRKLRKYFTDKPIKQNSLSLSNLENLFSQNNYQLFNTVKRSGFLHSLRLAVFKKVPMQ